MQTFLRDVLQPHTHNQDAHDIITSSSHKSNQMFHCLKIVLLVLVSHLQTKAFAFSRPYVQIVGTTAARNSRRNDVPSEGTRSRSVALASFNVDLTGLSKGALATFSIGVICFTGFMGPAYGDLGASNSANAKIQKGGASTLQSGRTISITRGVNLDRSDFHGQNLRGVAFQQSIVRDANFKGCNLYGASFFDATLDASDFEGADMTLANIEMAQLDRVNFKVRSVFMSLHSHRAHAYND